MDFIELLGLMLTMGVLAFLFGVALAVAEEM